MTILWRDGRTIQPAAVHKAGNKTWEFILSAHATGTSRIITTGIILALITKAKIEQLLNKSSIRDVSKVRVIASIKVVTFPSCQSTDTL